MAGTEQKPKDEDGITVFDNYFLDKVMRKAGGVEWKVICTVIRDSFNSLRGEADISVERFVEMTGAKRSRIFEAITAACKRGAVKRPQQRQFRFRPIRRGNLHEVQRRNPCLHVQEALQFAESENRILEPQMAVEIQSDNRTLESPKIGFPQAGVNPIIGLCESENRTLSNPVFNIDLNKDLNTHTHSEEDLSSKTGVCVFQPIDRNRYKSYARAHPRIDDPNAWATVAERTRQWDADVLEWEEAKRVDAERLKEEAAKLEAWRQDMAKCQEQQPSPDNNRVVSSEAVVDNVEESTAQREFREKREAAERAAQQRGEEMLAEIRQRNEEKKRSTG